MKVSIFLISFLSMKRPGSNPLTSPAMRLLKREASNRVMGPSPERPAVRASQFSALPTPSGDTRPTPVTATRRGEEERGMEGLVFRGVFLDVLDGVFDFLDLLGGFVRNLDVEGFLEGHDELDRVEGIGAEVVDEGRFRGHLIGVDAELLDDDALHLFFDGHSLPLLDLTSQKDAVFFPR